MRKYLIITIVIFWGVLGVAQSTFAFPSIVPVNCQGNAEVSVCNLSEVESMIGTVAQIVLGLAGSVTLAVFVVAGIMYTASGGNKNIIGKATDMLKNAFLGLVLIFLAGVIVKTLLSVLSKS